MTLRQHLLCALAANPSFVTCSARCGTQVHAGEIQHAIVLLEKLANEHAVPTHTPQSATPTEVDGAYLEELKKAEAYKSIDVGLEFGKMVQWCEVNRKKPSRRRLVNWLNLAASRSNASRCATQLHPSVRRMSLERELAEASAALRKLQNASAREISQPGYTEALNEAEQRVSNLRKQFNG